jgi:NAD(P)-dependent dehydrogenase (short-subunit alcohol dehydrogenase family)
MSTARRVVLVTGASSGIGAATAEHLLGRGHTVYATARRIEALKELADAGARTLPLDVTDEPSMVAAVAAVEDEEGYVGALVNNAGYGEYGPVEEVSMDAVRRQFETNVFGLARMCQLVLPGMRRAGDGRIVNVSSMGGRFTFPGGGFYHASKHAVEALSDALRFEVGGFGVKVSLVEPGLIRTRFDEVAIRTTDESTDTDGPYAEFARVSSQLTAGAYRSPLATSPKAVARVIAHSVESRFPRTRYRVTFGARAVIASRRLMPDRAWDLMIRTQYPRPKG